MTCSRRVVLKTIGIASAGCLVKACGGGGDDAPSMGVATMCGTDLCVSLADNPELADVNGSLYFEAPGHKIHVVRTSATELQVVSAICTHAFCTTAWNGRDSFDCPCHGSKFAIDGTATHGPAVRALRVYSHTVVGDTLTIVLT